MGKVSGSRCVLCVVVGVALLLMPPPVDAKRRHRHHRHASALTTAKPFPEPVTGCFPIRERVAECEEDFAKAAGKLVSRVLRCHAKQASQAFGDADFDDFNEERCEASAKRKFTSDIGEARDQNHCPSSLLVNLEQFQDLMVERLDSNNGDIYCEGGGDSAAGALIDPSGDDSGHVPASQSTLGCANEVTDELGDFTRDILHCHGEAAENLVEGERFDVTKCRQAARDKYRSEIDETLGEFTCPSCLDIPGQVFIADHWLEFLDQNNGLIFLCPEGPTTTSTTSTTTTTTTTTEESTTTTSTTSTTTTSTTQGSPTGAFLDPTLLL